jgi:hypothetical protein
MLPSNAALPAILLAARHCRKMTKGDGGARRCGSIFFGVSSLFA